MRVLMQGFWASGPALVAVALSTVSLTACAERQPRTFGSVGSTVSAPLAADTAWPGEALDGIRVVSRLPERTGQGGERPISADDLIRIDVFQVDQLDRSVRVGESGAIALPLIGEVKAAGLSARQLEVDLQQRYGKDYLESPQISVFVEESAAQKATVDGEVRQPGVQPVTSSSSLSSVVAEAGGLSQIADATKIFVFREASGEKLVARYDLKSIRSGGASDPRIYGGDVVIVFDSRSKTAMRNLREALGVVRGATGIL